MLRPRIFRQNRTEMVCTCSSLGVSACCQSDLHAILLSANLADTERNTYIHWCGCSRSSILCYVVALQNFPSSLVCLIVFTQRSVSHLSQCTFTFTIIGFPAKLTAAATSSVLNTPSKVSTDMTVFIAPPDKVRFVSTMLQYSLANNEQVKQGKDCFHTLRANVQVLRRQCESVQQV